jgi:chromosome condensin MukBEF ATPase and DNA-binding subunit MukB
MKERIEAKGTRLVQPGASNKTLKSAADKEAAVVTIPADEADVEDAAHFAALFCPGLLPVRT